jgi:MFS family permease
MSTSADAIAATPPSWSELLLGRLGATAWTLSLGTGMHAIAWYILATALPSTVEDVGGAPLVSWIVSTYLIASIVSGAASGLVKARFGSRPLLLIATALFLAGTLTAAVAPTMEIVILGRTLQGAGEGVIWAVSAMLVKDLFPNATIPAMYGILAVVWSLGAVFGPLLSGVLTEAAGWRGALLGMVPLVLVYAFMVAFVLPPVAPSRASLRFPFGRLLIVAAGVVALLVGGVSTHAGASLAALLLALAIVAGALRLDAAADIRLFPRRLLAPTTVVPLGIWTMTLMFAAEAAVSVYAALLAQLLFGASPMVAGYAMAIVAFAWTASALATARRGTRVADAGIVAGPALLVVGHAGVAMALVASSFAGFCLALALVGTGFGVAYTFVHQRVLAAAETDESDVTAGALPTLEAAGAAFGAGLAGLCGNLLGLGDPGQIDRFRDAAAWVMAGAAVVALPAVAGAIALVRIGRR